MLTLKKKRDSKIRYSEAGRDTLVIYLSIPCALVKSHIHNQGLAQNDQQRAPYFKVATTRICSSHPST